MSDRSLADRLGILWFVRHPFEVLARSLTELKRPAGPDERPDLEARYRQISRRGTTAVRIRGVVLVLFYFAALVTLVGGVGGVLGRFAFLDALYRTAFAASAGFSALFGIAAAVLGRYIAVLQNRLVVLALRLQRGASR
jgi:hypothetical protein